MIFDTDFPRHFAAGRESLLRAERKLPQENVPDEAAVARKECRESSPEIMLAFCTLAWLVVVGLAAVLMLL